MGSPFLFLLLNLILSFPLSSEPFSSLTAGSSLSVENSKDVLISPNGIFSAGFYPVGDNAYSLAIWFTNPFHDGQHSVVWMANRNQPVNGKGSKLSLLRSGNLILSDAGGFTVWATNTAGISEVKLQLYDAGNLVLLSSVGMIMWQSFDSPTDTLLPRQPLTRNTRLISSRSQTNFSTGFYKLCFDNNNVLSLMYDGPDISSVYWPYPWLVSWKAGRSAYNSSRIASLDSLGYFTSSDGFSFRSSDFGGVVQRKLRLDFDGNFRLYSLEEESGMWAVTWQALPKACRVHGVCGPNSVCSYFPDSESGRRCSCIPGYEMKDPSDWSNGCRPKFNLSCDSQEAGFLLLPHLEFYGYDYGFYPNYSLQSCKTICLKLCDCKAFQYKFHQGKRLYNCFPKTLLFNGYSIPGFQGDVYLKLPKSGIASYQKSVENFKLDCSAELIKQLPRTYSRSHENGLLRFMLWFACAVGGVETICIVSVWCFLRKAHQNPIEGYILVSTRFRRFTYAELKRATHGFSEEMGRGGGGVVYKGVLSDNRVAAIKKLNVSNQGEAQFLAEVSTIGRLNHINLIELWGYCAEGKQKLLVYEYMENGSLAENLSSKTLDWEKRFGIAVGTAKGLAYLHEECSEWVLHCDVKPQNILLDPNHMPKVADFGLSKLLNRGGGENSSFSRMRGTRGYMAPEWVLNLPITSKVDVYSYGILILEMVTGKSPAMDIGEIDGAGQHQGLVKWVRGKKMKGATVRGTSCVWIEEIVDPVMEGKYDMNKMESLVSVALQCVEEDKDERPSMGKVLDLLLHHESQNHY